MSDTFKATVLLSTQSLAAGNGGICAVARMTAASLQSYYQLDALACQDAQDQRIGTVAVRSFANRRLPFLLANVVAVQRADRVIYDFAGTARAHVDAPFRRRPYAVWIHGWEVWEASSPKYLRAVAGAQLVLANSDYTVKRANGAFANAIEVVACPLATSQPEPPDKIGPADGPPTVMLLGRADELFAKGHDILIEVWSDVVSAVPNARLLLVGGGNAVGRVRDLAAASTAHNSIEITGFVSDEAIDAYWARATVFAMLGFAEGFGLVYAEAMRRALPVVASLEDAGQEINVDEITGFNVSRNNKKRLTEVLVTLLRDYNLARSLGAAGHLRWKELYTFAGFDRRFKAATKRFLAI